MKRNSIQMKLTWTFCTAILCSLLVTNVLTGIYIYQKYSLQGTTQGNGLTGGLPPVRFSM